MGPFHSAKLLRSGKFPTPRGIPNSLPTQPELAPTRPMLREFPLGIPNFSPGSPEWQATGTGAFAVLESGPFQTHSGFP